MSALKSLDLISLQSTIFLEESTDSFSAHRPISTASKYSKKRGGSAFIKRKTLKFPRSFTGRTKNTEEKNILIPN